MVNFLTLSSEETLLLYFDDAVKTYFMILTSTVGFIISKRHSLLHVFDKVGCAVRMFFSSQLLMEFGRNDHHVDAPLFINDFTTDYL